jgi:hypothetical protein
VALRSRKLDVIYADRAKGRNCKSLKNKGLRQHKTATTKAVYVENWLPHEQKAALRPEDFLEKES